MAYFLTFRTVTHFASRGPFASVEEAEAYVRADPDTARNWHYALREADSAREAEDAHKHHEDAIAWADEILEGFKL